MALASQQNSPYRSQNDLVNIDNVHFYINKCFSQAGQRQNQPQYQGRLQQTPLKENILSPTENGHESNQQQQTVKDSFEQEVSRHFPISINLQNVFPDASSNIKQIDEDDNTVLFDSNSQQRAPVSHSKRISLQKRGSIQSFQPFNHLADTSKNSTPAFASPLIFKRRQTRLRSSVDDRTSKGASINGLNKDEDIVKHFEILLKQKFFYQDLFKPDFCLNKLDYSLCNIENDGKMKLMNSLLEILYKTDKLKHVLPPMKIQQFKKQNARPYNYKEKQFQNAFGGADDSEVANMLREIELKKKGIKISESTRKRKSTAFRATFVN